MREREIEKYLRTEVEYEGGKCIKLTGVVGIPDRLILLKGSVCFVEVKNEKGVVSPAQTDFGGWLERAGYMYAVVDSYEKVDNLIHTILEGGCFETGAA